MANVNTAGGRGELTKRNQDNQKGDKDGADDYCELHVAELCAVGVIYDNQHH